MGFISNIITADMDRQSQEFINKQNIDFQRETNLENWKHTQEINKQQMDYQDKVNAQNELFQREINSANINAQKEINDANLKNQSQINSQNIASAERINQMQLDNQNMINQQNIDFQREVNDRNSISGRIAEGRANGLNALSSMGLSGNQTGASITNGFSPQMAERKATQKQAHQLQAVLKSATALGTSTSIAPTVQAYKHSFPLMNGDPLAMANELESLKQNKLVTEFMKEHGGRRPSEVNSVLGTIEQVANSINKIKENPEAFGIHGALSTITDSVKGVGDIKNDKGVALKDMFKVDSNGNYKPSREDVAKQLSSRFYKDGVQVKIGKLGQYEVKKPGSSWYSFATKKGLYKYLGILDELM